MRIVFMFLAFVVLLGTCKGSQPADITDALVSMKGCTLNRSEMNKLIPRGVPSADSLLLTEGFIKKRIEGVLVYDVALRDLGDEKEEVNKLVEEYRRSLVRYRYQERLVEEKLKIDIRESDKLNYHEENQKKFILDKGLTKGLLLKVPADAPGLTDIRKWYKLTDVASSGKIEKYGMQNTTIYEYFHDKWIDLDEVMDNIPIHVSNPNAFLKTNKYAEVADSSYCYLLNIKEYLPFGSAEPYGYTSSHVTEILANQRRVEFLKKFEDELYNDATRSGDVEFHSGP